MTDDTDTPPADVLRKRGSFPFGADPDAARFPAHPLADLFPMMGDAELAKLADDIRERGLADPIVLHDGLVLDGRNRQLACERAGVRPEYTPYAGTDPAGFVVSHNLHRRHLTTGQRAMVAAKLANLRVGDNQHSDGASVNLPTLPGTGPDGASVNLPRLDSPAPPPVSQAQAATLLNVSPKAVQHGKTVIDDGVAELVKLAEAGDVSVSAAATVAAELPPDDQQRVVAGGAKAVKAKAAELRGKGSPAAPATETKGDELARHLTRLAAQMTKWLNSGEASAELFKNYAGSLQKGEVIKHPHTLVSHEHVERAAGKKPMCLFTGLRALRQLVGKCNDRSAKPLAYAQLRKWWQTEVGTGTDETDGGAE